MIKLKVMKLAFAGVLVLSACGGAAAPTSSPVATTVPTEVAAATNSPTESTTVATVEATSVETSTSTMSNTTTMTDTGNMSNTSPVSSTTMVTNTGTMSATGAETSTGMMSNTTTMTDTSNMSNTSPMSSTTMVTDTGAISSTGAETKTGIMTNTGTISGMTVGETAMADNQFSTLVKLAVLAGITPTLTGPDPITVFAPTNAAFGKLPQATLDDLMKPENKAKLVKILTYHVVSGKVMAADMSTITTVKSVEGSDLKITLSAGIVMVNDAKVTSTDITTKNGIIHVIDTVLMPPDVK